MKQSAMMNNGKSRVDRLQSAYPFLSRGQCRALLVYNYAKHDNVPRHLIEPIMDAYIGGLISGGEDEVRNYLARVEECFPVPLEQFND